jgi:hypothetical protein
MPALTTTKGPFFTLKPNLILHVGMDKTGTSSIQFALQESHNDLAKKHQVLVPRSGLWTDFSHHPFAFAALGMNGFTPADLEGLFRGLEKEIVAQAPKTVLISSECLFKLPTHPAITDFWARLQRIFAQIRVVIYVRRQDKWIESRYRHSVISGNELRIEKLSGQNYANYLTFIDLWGDLAGTANVTVRPYEAAQFPGGDIAADFEALIGLPAGALPKLRDAHHNATFPAKAVLLRAAFNHLDLPAGNYSHLNKLLLEVVPDSTPNARFVSPAAAALLVKRYEKSNADIARKYGGRPDGKLFHDPLPDAKAPWAAPKLTPDEMADFLSQLGQKSPGLLEAAALGLKTLRMTDLPSSEAASGVWRLTQGLRTLGVIQEEAKQAAGAAVQKGKGSHAHVKIKRAAVIGYVKWRQLAFKVSSTFKMLRADTRPTGNQKSASTQSGPIADEPLGGAVLTAPASIKARGQRADERELLVHYGTPKTGSTSIQQTLFNHDQGLTNCAYVHGRLPNSSLMIGNSFQSAAAIATRSPGSESSEVEWRRSVARDMLTKALNRASAKSNRLVLSAEVIAALSKPELTKMRDWLAPYAQQIRFIGYIRDPVSSTRSIFQEQIKTKYPPGFTFDAYFSQPGGGYRMVERLDALFGRDAVTILPFDKSLFPGGDVVQHFLATAQISGNGLKSESVNESLSHLAVKALFCYRSLRERFDAQPQYASREAFIGSLRALDGPSFAVHGDVEQSLRANCQHWDDWAEKRLGRSLPYADSFKDYGIRSESDLMTFSPEELEKFASYAASYGITSISARSGADDVAGALHVIRNHFVTVGQSVTKQVWRAATKG